MRAHPFLVAGTKRVCTALMQAPSEDLVVKAGAEGVLCFASPSAGVAGAIKIDDGAGRATAPVACAVIGSLDLVHVTDALEPFASPPVLGGGLPVGVMRVAGALEKA